VSLADALTRRGWLLACSGLAAAAALVALLATRDGRAEVRSCRSTLIPAYVSAGEVAELARRSQRERLLVINPASGPGVSADQAYQQAVAAAKKAGARVLGYVPTSYGARDVSAVEGDIDRYTSWYDVDGIFLDEASNDEGALAYYGALARHIRSSPGRLVVLNPGMVPARGYFNLADVVVTFEGPVGSYAAAVERTPSWLGHVPAGRIAHLVYGASREQALQAIALRAHARYVYAAAGSQPHPWSLPDYVDEVQALLAKC
jgi:Spherulation-specific family 4